MKIRRVSFSDRSRKDIDRREFLTTVGVSLGAGSLFGSHLDAQTVPPPRNVRIVPGTPAPSAVPANVLKPSDISYVGCMRMPSTGVDTAFSYGGLAGRVVGGQLRLFVHGRNPTGAKAGIVSGSSGSSFAVGSGQGASFHIGEKVNVARAANGNNVPESRRIQSISGDQVTVAPPLGGVPAYGDTLYRDQDYYVYELADTGSYHTDYSQAPRMSLVAAWPDIFNGRRVTWRNGRLFAPMQYLVPGGLY